MQFKVPQNIMMEDHIIGSLTMFQFILALIGGGIAFLFLNIRAIAPVNYVLAIVTGIFSFIIVVGRFNDPPMYRFFRYIVLFIITPRTRIWHKGGTTPNLVRPAPPKADKNQRHGTKNVSRADIARLAAVIDSRGTVGGQPPAAKPAEPPK